MTNLKRGRTSSVEDLSFNASEPMSKVSKPTGLDSPPKTLEPSISSLEEFFCNLVLPSPVTSKQLDCLHDPAMTPNNLLNTSKQVDCPYDPATTSNTPLPGDKSLLDITSSPDGLSPHPDPDPHRKSLCDIVQSVELRTLQRYCLHLADEIKVLSASINMLEEKLNAFTKTSASILNPPLNHQGPDNHEAQSLSRGQQLVNLQLTPNNICLNIAHSCFPYYAWRNCKAAVISLRMLTRSYLAQGDLLSLEWLPETPKFKRLLLKFDSPRLPALLSKLQNRLNWYGIFPQRCFFNNCRGIIGKIPNSANLVSRPTRRIEDYDRNSQQRTLPMNPSLRFTSRPPHRQEGTALRGRALTGPALAIIDAPKDWQTEAHVDPPAAITISNPQNGCTPCADTMTMQETLGDPAALWTNTEAVARLNKLLEANRKEIGRAHV